MVKVIHVTSEIVNVRDALKAVTERINEELGHINGVVQRVEMPQYARYPASETSTGPGTLRQVRAYAMVVITYTPNAVSNTGAPSPGLAF